MTPDKSLSPMTVQQLLDREQLRDVAMRYCRGVDRLDADCMKSAYWPEAIDEHGSFIGNAHDFSDYCMTAHLRWKWTMHSIYNHQIDELEVNDVLQNPGEDRPGYDGARVVIGQASSGRFLRVVYVADPEEPENLFVITAYELRGKPLIAYRRRRRRKHK